MNEGEPTESARRPSDTGHDAIPPADHVIVPTVEEIISTNGAFQLLDDEWKHPETRPADPSAPPLGGDPSLDWTSLRRVNDVWAKIAMRDHGRVGRDPDRIEPFLRLFELVWERYSQLRFGELVSHVMSVPEPPMPLHAPEETTFVQLLAEWDDTQTHQKDGATSVPESNEGGRSQPIRPFLDRFQEAWDRDPDQRFGQLVGNIMRLNRSSESIESISDEDYLALLNERMEPNP